MKKRIILTGREMDLVKEHVLPLLDPEYDQAVRKAFRERGNWNLAVEDAAAVEGFIDAVAAEANHAGNPKVRNALDALVERLKKRLPAGHVSVKRGRNPSPYSPHPNEVDRLRIERAFPSPVPDKVRNVVEPCRSGYVLYESRPPWNGEGAWTMHSVAKMAWARAGFWRLYWMRASGKWEPYAEDRNLGKVIEVIREDGNGCFFG